MSIETTVIFEGETPSKKNARNVRILNGRVLQTPSNRYNKWHKDQVRSFPSCEKLTPPYRVTITIYPKTRRKADLTNKAESIMDLMVDVGLLEDDNWFCVPEVSLKFGAVDKDNPRAEVVITSADSDAIAA